MPEINHPDPPPTKRINTGALVLLALLLVVAIVLLAIVVSRPQKQAAALPPAPPRPSQPDFLSQSPAGQALDEQRLSRAVERALQNSGATSPLPPQRPIATPLPPYPPSQLGAPPYDASAFPGLPPDTAGGIPPNAQGNAVGGPPSARMGGEDDHASTVRRALRSPLDPFATGGASRSDFNQIAPAAYGLGPPPTLPDVEHIASQLRKLQAGAGAPPEQNADATAGSRSSEAPVATSATHRGNGGPVIPAGTVIPAILLTAVNTEVAAELGAMVTNDVHGNDGEVLIPRGARLYGTPRNQIAVGQHRLAVAWNRLVLPGGTEYDLPGLPGRAPDASGGLPGDVNNHFGAVFGRAIALSVIAAGAQLSQPRESNTLVPGTRQIAAAAAGQQLTDAAAEILRQAVDIRPTLTIKAGERISIFIASDLSL